MISPSRHSFRVAVVLLFLSCAVTTFADTYTVTNTNASGAGSLGQAILDANARTGQDTIAFNIPGSGVHLIDLSKTALPAVSDPVVIDGYTQPGASPNSLSVGDDAVILIQLDGGLVGNGNNGITITGSNCVVRGLSITGFMPGPGDGFNISPGGSGIELKPSGTGNSVEGNFIGITPDGQTARANSRGVRLGVAPQTVGGMTPASRNVISGNSFGIFITGSAGGTLIEGNYIGTDVTGTRKVGNIDGIEVAAKDLTIGGTSIGAGNLISGNQSAGVQIGSEIGNHVIAHADRTTVVGNLIGTQADGASPLGNGAGISFLISSNCTIGGENAGAGNVIAFNAWGVLVSGAANRILSNSIYSDNGPAIIFTNPTYVNNGQAAPAITIAFIAHGNASIQGNVHSSPNTEMLIQVFADSQSLATSRQTYLGSTRVTTDGNGDATFAAIFPISVSNVELNTTATDAAGNTSVFSRNPAYLLNLSARADVGVGENALIGGVIMKWGQVILRGMGPSLTASGVTNALPDPTLEMHDHSGAQTFNDNWKDDPSQADQVQQNGLAPSSNAEAALAPFSTATSPFHPTTGFAPYTAIVRGKNNTTGIGLIETYGIVATNYTDISKLGNLSARGFVGTGDKAIIGGFILGGGTEHPRICVRAIGPSLKVAGVTNPLVDPVLELHDGNGALIATNDDWADVQSDDLKSVGLAPPDSHESAILTRLESGAYTAVVRGRGNTTGVGLIEIYNLQ
jgi:parallel beta-helix repeat protein